MIPRVGDFFLPFFGAQVALGCPEMCSKYVEHSRHVSPSSWPKVLKNFLKKVDEMMTRKDKQTTSDTKK